jgi:hypothetical protein
MCFCAYANSPRDTLGEWGHGQGLPLSTATLALGDLNEQPFDYWPNALTARLPAALTNGILNLYKSLDRSAHLLDYQKELWLLSGHVLPVRVGKVQLASMMHRDNISH